MNKTIFTLPVFAAFVLTLPACHFGHSHDEEHHEPHGQNEHAHEEEEHGHAHDDDEDEHGHAHGEDDHGHGFEGASEVLTTWGETTQLFVEFPALVVASESPFAAHLTRISDHFAIDEGVVTVELSGPGQTTETFRVEGVSRAGIFRPVVRPALTGTRRVTLRLESAAATETHDLGEFTVFPSRAMANEAAPDEEASDEEISYLLEQQWVVPFNIERVDVRPIRPNVRAFARLTLPPNAASYVTAPRDGRVANTAGVAPGVGVEVAAGDVLFELSLAPQENADQASLQLAADQAAIGVDAARRDVERLAPLVEQGVVAQRRLDDATSVLAQEEAALRAARRRLSTLGQSQRVGGGGETIAVPSPINGEITELLAAPGSWVTAGQPLARVVNRDVLWLDASIPETYAGRIAQVSGAWFVLDSVEGVIEVTNESLVSVGTEINAETRTLPIRFRVDNTDRRLFAGMSALAYVIADTPRDAAAVHVNAVIDDAGTDVVYVQTGGETFIRRPVQLGLRDGDYIEVLNGVAAGEWVAARGAQFVKLASTSTAEIGHGHAH